MTVFEYVARDFNIEWGTGTVVGTDPLDTIDGDTSYVTAQWDGTTTTAATTFRLEPVGAPAPPESTWISVRARLAWRRVTPNVPPGSGVALHAYDDEGSPQLVAVNFGEAFSGVPDEDVGGGYTAMWSDATVDKWPRLLAADSFQAFGLIGTTGTPASEFRATYYRVFIEAGTPHLRQRNRGRLRQRNKAARQDGIRQRGFL